MILTMIGCCLVGGGLKGFVDSNFRKQNRARRPIREHTPVAS